MGPTIKSLIILVILCFLLTLKVLVKPTRNIDKKELQADEGGHALMQTPGLGVKKFCPICFLVKYLLKLPLQGAQANTWMKWTKNSAQR